MGEWRTGTGRTPDERPLKQERIAKISSRNVGGNNGKKRETQGVRFDALENK